jgi:hypothetical protein
VPEAWQQVASGTLLDSFSPDLEVKEISCCIEKAFLYNFDMSTIIAWARYIET